MFKSKTLFIVGAGASKEVKMPLGEDLKRDIAISLNTGFGGAGQIRNAKSRKMYEVIYQHSRSGESYSKDVLEYLTHAKAISDAMPLAISIDNYIDAHQKNPFIELCGKLAIVRSILDAERNSSLYSDDPYIEEHWEGSDFKRLEGTWLAGFFNMLTENVTKDSIESVFENVAFITFNYDRCIEQYLYKALQTYYSVTPQEAGNVLSKLTIIHPYGSVGKFPHIGGDGMVASYGDERADLLKVAKQIKTFSQQIEEPEILDKIHDEIEKAQKLVFLGFAFHPQNMDLLQVNKLRRLENKIQVYATMYGVSKSDQEEIKKDIVSVTGRHKKFTDINTLDPSKKCSDLFYEYKRSLPA